MSGLSTDATNALLLLAGMLCMIGASYSICYAIWLRGWEGWESWSARTGLNEDEALAERIDRLQHDPRNRRI